MKIIIYSQKKLGKAYKKESIFSKKKITRSKIRNRSTKKTLLPIAYFCHGIRFFRATFRELGGKHNWKQDNPEHVSLSYDEMLLEDYYSRSIIQFRVKRNDRGSRKRTSPEIRTRKRTKGDFPSLHSTHDSLFALTNSLAWSIFRVKLHERNFFFFTIHMHDKDARTWHGKRERLLFTARNETPSPLD